ncbi:MAG: hypothetical protein KJ808_07285 [Acidobacteria bacterium]|nr:hypothetical protein [Acidobacteriota bacterium]MBU4307719.1 hypothetical protein [Acidobacteriota bacterium]MCG2811827.1 hypothetical protein [Candidatus Aminicenantes bacterium]
MKDKSILSPSFEEVDKEMVAVYRDKTPLDRLKIASGLWRLSRNVLAGSLRFQHPDWDEKKIKAEVARRMAHGTT